MNTFVKNVMFTAFQNLEMECFFFMWAIVNLYYASLTPDKYRKSSIKPPAGLINFKHIWGVGGWVGLFEKGAYLK